MVCQNINRLLLISFLFTTFAIIYQYYHLHYNPILLDSHCQHQLIQGSKYAINCISCYNFDKYTKELGYIKINTFGKAQSFHSKVIYQSQCFEYECIDLQDPTDYADFKEKNAQLLAQLTFLETNHFNQYQFLIQQKTNRKGFLIKYQYKFQTYNDIVQKPTVYLHHFLNSYSDSTLFSTLGLISLQQTSILFLFGFTSGLISFIISSISIFMLLYRYSKCGVWIAILIWILPSIFKTPSYVITIVNILLVITLTIMKNNSGYLHLLYFIILSIICSEQYLVEISRKIPQMIYFNHNLGMMINSEKQKILESEQEEDIQLKIKRQLGD